MKTATDFQNKLIELKNEQMALIAQFGKRKKSIRERIQEINKEFFATKELWRTTLG